jgi:hypothetical protein
MPATECERCHARTNPKSYELYDYCAVCSKNLCPACMAKGCCGNVPALSGAADDAEADDETDVN